MGPVRGYRASRMNEIVAFIVAVGHVTNVAKTLIQARDQAQRSSLQIDLNGAILDLQSKISAIQVSYQALLDTNESLKKQLVAHERWEQERARYALCQPERGCFVYGLKPDDASGEPRHWLCPNCYQAGKKSILQRFNDICHTCPSCGTNFDLSKDA